MKFTQIVLALLLGACATSPQGSFSDRISGRVTSVVDGAEGPVAQASVRLSIPGKTELVAVAITTAEGTFFIDHLSNRRTEEEVSLVRHQEYEVELRAAGYVLVKQRVTFGQGPVDWTFNMVSNARGLDCEG